MRHLWVMDPEAYAERIAIMEAEGVDTLTASRDAADYAYKTRFGVVATAAANGDWEVAREWCRQERDRFGIDLARELMRDIQRAVAEKLRW